MTFRGKKQNKKGFCSVLQLALPSYYANLEQLDKSLAKLPLYVAGCTFGIHRILIPLVSFHINLCEILSTLTLCLVYTFVNLSLCIEKVFRLVCSLTMQDTLSVPDSVFE